jgi:HEAT repeat protein
MGEEERFTTEELQRRAEAIAAVQSHPELAERRSQIASHHAEAVKKIAEAASELLNVVFKDNVSLSPFMLSGVMNEKLDLISEMLIDNESLAPDARADVTAAKKLSQTLKWRIRQISQSNAYDDDKGPYYYWKLAALDAFQLMIPRTGELDPRGPLSKLLSDQSPVIRVAAAGVLNGIFDETSRLLLNPVEACHPERAYLQLDRLKQVHKTLRYMAQSRMLEGGIGSAKIPLHPDEEELLMELIQR